MTPLHHSWNPNNNVIPVWTSILSEDIKMDICHPHQSASNITATQRTHNIFHGLPLVFASPCDLSQRRYVKDVRRGEIFIKWNACNPHGMVQGKSTPGSGCQLNCELHVIVSHAIASCAASWCNYLLSDVIHLYIKRLYSLLTCNVRLLSVYTISSAGITN